MLKKERAAYIEKRLSELYPDPPIPLDHTNNFTLLVIIVSLLRLGREFSVEYLLSSLIL